MQLGSGVMGQKLQRGNEIFDPMGNKKNNEGHLSLAWTLVSGFISEDRFGESFPFKVLEYKNNKDVNVSIGLPLVLKKVLKNSPLNTPLRLR